MSGSKLKDLLLPPVPIIYLIETKDGRSRYVDIIDFIRWNEELEARIEKLEASAVPVYSKAKDIWLKSDHLNKADFAALLICMEPIEKGVSTTDIVRVLLDVCAKGYYGPEMEDLDYPKIEAMARKLEREGIKPGGSK